MGNDVWACPIDNRPKHKLYHPKDVVKMGSMPILLGSVIAGKPPIRCTTNSIIRLVG